MSPSKSRKRKQDSSTPQQPRKIQKLYEQILAHPKYKDLGESTRWAFQMGCVNGLSWATRQNNKWSRRLWKHLFLGEALED